MDTRFLCDEMLGHLRSADYDTLLEGNGKRDNTRLVSADVAQPIAA